MQASTVNDLYYLQALNNLAMMYDSPGSIPYFALPSQGTNQNQRSLTATYMPTWDFITAKGFYAGRWLLDHNSAAFGGTTQCSAPQKLDRCIMEGWVLKEGASTWRSDDSSAGSSRRRWSWTC
jgi:hypothetical protein